MTKTQINTMDIDTVITEALRLYESGTSVSEILLRYPKDEKILRDIFDITDRIKTSGNKITPPQNTLQVIVQKTKALELVTSKESARYTKTEETSQGSFWSFIQNIISLLRERVSLNYSYAIFSVAVLLFLCVSYGILGVPKEHGNAQAILAYTIDETTILIDDDFIKKDLDMLDKEFEVLALADMNSGIINDIDHYLVINN